MACAICNTRKEKRFCPAVHGRICPQCCGEQREVTLDCPSDCVYLLQAREHEKPRTVDDLDPKLLFLDIEVNESFMYEHEHLLTGLSFALAKTSRSDASIRDRDLLSAIGGLCESYNTLVNSGLVYETPNASQTQAAIRGELQLMIKEFRGAELKHMGHSRLQDFDVLRALVFLVRLGYSRSSGRPKARGFRDFLISQLPEPTPAIAGAGEVSGQIIVP